MSKLINFQRFKKKSFILLLTIFPEEEVNMTENIRFKKLFQCIFKLEVLNYRDENDKIINKDYVRYLLKINTTTIVIVTHKVKL